MIAICVGHSRSGDQGAVSVGGISEHAYNTQLAGMVSKELTRRALANTVISSYQGSGYTAAMRWVAAEVRRLKAQVCIELHFNSADRAEAHGHEWLFWVHSAQGRFLAQALSRRMKESFPAMAARGIKSIMPSDRGAEFLRLTPCPACICEPFFGSNGDDWQFATQHMDRLALVIANGINDWLGGHA